MNIQHYLNAKGEDLYQNWLDGLRDVRAQARITTRISRVAAGAFGDCKPVGEGVWELRIDYAAGYRIYYAIAGKTLILLLLGGDKSTQTKDIQRAIACWKDFQEN